MGTEGAGAGVGPPREGQRAQGERERRMKEGKGGRKGDRNREEGRDYNKAIRAVFCFFFEWSMHGCGEKAWWMF